MAYTRLGFCFFLLLVVAKAQCCTRTPIHESDEDDTEVTIVVPLTAIKLIQGIGDFVTDSWMVGIKRLIDVTARLEADLYSTEMGLINLVWQSAITNLNEIAKDTGKFGKAPIQCTQDCEDDVKKIFYDYAYETLKCQTENAHVKVNAMVPILKDIRVTSGGMRNLIVEMGNCENDTAPVSCIDRVTKKMQLEVTDLTAAIGEDIDALSTLLDEITVALPSCRQNATNKLRREYISFSNVIFNCVQEKVNIGRA